MPDFLMELDGERGQKKNESDLLLAEGAVGRVQRKLLDFGEVRGLMFGAFGEASSGCMS